MCTVMPLCVYVIVRMMNVIEHVFLEEVNRISYIQNDMAVIIRLSKFLILILSTARVLVDSVFVYPYLPIWLVILYSCMIFF